MLVCIQQNCSSHQEKMAYTNEKNINFLWKMTWSSRLHHSLFKPSFHFNVIVWLFEHVGASPPISVWEERTMFVAMGLPAICSTRGWKRGAPCSATITWGEGTLFRTWQTCTTMCCRSFTVVGILVRCRTEEKGGCPCTQNAKTTLDSETSAPATTTSPRGQVTVVIHKDRCMYYIPVWEKE